MKQNKYKKIVMLFFCFILIMIMCSCASLERLGKDIKSDVTNGLNRTITVYTADGQEMARYKGKIDIEATDGYVKFDFNGKRYIYYNCFVEAIEED